MVRSRPRRRWLLLLLIADLALLSTGVAVAAGRRAEARGSGQRAAAPPRARPTPAPQRTIVIPPRTHYEVGQTATVVDPSTGAQLQIEVGAPSLSSNALGYYGYGPQDGWYLSFPVTVHNAGAVQILLKVLDFVVDESGLPDRNVYDGNSPYSGAPHQLDNTLLAPGQTVSAPLIYDEPLTHGLLRWVVGGVTECSWSF